MQLIDSSPQETKPRLLGLTRDHVLREMDRHDIGLRLNVRNGKYEWRNGRSDNDVDHTWGDCPREAEAEIRRLLAAEAAWDERTRIQPTPFEEIKLQIGHCTRIDPWLEHLKSLPPWDGIPRVATLFSRLWTLADGHDVAICAAEAAISLIWGAVLRTFHPGAEHDEVAVLISENQGFGKSKFGKWLFPPELSEACFTDGVKLNALGTLAERDMMAGIVGRVLIELADLAGIRKADLQTVNGWITQTADELSLKWRHTQTFPRRFVMLGTSDRPDAALPPDPAGHRRWLPVHLQAPHGGLTIPESGFHVRDVLKADNDQLWAEGVSWLATGRPVRHERLWDALDAQRGTHTEASPLAELIRDALDPRDTFRTQQEIWQALENHVASSAHNTVLPANRRNELADALRAVGWRRRTTRMLDGATPKRYAYDDGEPF